MKKEKDRYYLIKKNTVVKEVFSDKLDSFISEIDGEKVEYYPSVCLEFRDGQWYQIPSHFISDRINGYDPYEVDVYSFGNSEISEQIEYINEDEADKLIQNKDYKYVCTRVDDWDEKKESDWSLKTQNKPWDGSFE